MKAVVLDGYTLNPGDLNWNCLDELVDLKVYDRTGSSDIVNRIGDCEFVFTNKTPIDKNTIDNCPNIQYIGVLATGYNIVDIEYCMLKNIVVTNIPSYGTASVAQHVLALLLELTNNVGFHSELVKRGEWAKQPDFCFWRKPLVELSGKTAGIVGFGRIGSEVAKILHSFGMNIIAYNKSKIEFDHFQVTQVSFEELLKSSDVVTLHVPLLEDTFHLINDDSIKLMKKTSIIINTSRGQLINEQSLISALKKGDIYAAGLDVVEVEPIDCESELLNLDNCIITPHIAWAPLESRSRLLTQVCINLKEYLEGNVINNVTK